VISTQHDEAATASPERRHSQEMESAYALHGEYDDDFWRRFTEQRQEYDAAETGAETPMSNREQNDADSLGHLSPSQLLSMVVTQL